jgi:hypothetical protein
MKSIDQLDIVIRQASGQVVAGIPQIALYAKAESIEAAIELLKAKRAALLDDVAAAALPDATAYIAVPEPPVGGGESIGRFAMKAAIITFLAVAAMVVSGGLLIHRIEGAVAQVAGGGKLTGKEFREKLELGLERAADPKYDMPEEKKQKMLSQLRVVVNRWRPFTAEIAALFSNLPPPEAAGAPQSPSP